MNDYQVKRCYRCGAVREIGQFPDPTARVCSPCWAEWKCLACRKGKPEVEFYEKKGGKLSSLCRGCHIAGTRERYRTSKSNPVRHMFDRVRYRAGAEKIEFTITEADILIPECCPITGHKLLPVGQSGQHEDAPSLDRVDPRRGYVPGNVAVMSKRGNMLKGGATLEEHKRILEFMRKAMKQ